MKGASANDVLHLLGFTLVYIAGMAALLIINMPVFEESQTVLLDYLMVPAALVGLGMIGVAQLRMRR